MWGKSCPTREDVIVLTGLPVFGELRTVNLLEESEEVNINGEGERKLAALNKALTDLKVKTKSTYSS